MNLTVDIIEGLRKLPAAIRIEDESLERKVDLLITKNKKAFLRIFYESEEGRLAFMRTAWNEGEMLDAIGNISHEIKVTMQLQDVKMKWIKSKSHHINIFPSFHKKEPCSDYPNTYQYILTGDVIISSRDLASLQSLPEIPNHDEFYIKDQKLIWFQDGIAQELEIL